MVTIALVSFGLMVVAWALAPDGARHPGQASRESGQETAPAAA